ncbi:MAG TPA: DNA-3-methyladenine glycosylase 2 family protein [Acidimicrobiia bacterium]|nr:DNA-3-methyladenine glycosylase 2 family protein [Acidimicrobiia bacterium]
MPRIRKVVVEATDELARRDRGIRRMLAVHGYPELRRKSDGRTHFAALARSICYQQLAGRAAAAIHGRFVALYDGDPTPEAVLATPVDTMRACGLSASKAASIRDLALAGDDGRVAFDRLGRLPDDEVVRELVQVRGIGEWTAQMFLMFQLGRLDVWPTLDYGVRSGFTKLYALGEMPSPKQLAPLGDPFAPYRSVVAWYCWRAADTEL